MEFTEPLTAVIPPPGIVLLNDKQTPICERHNVKDLINNHGDSEFMAYTRGIVDVSEFKLYLRSLPPSIWDDEHQDGNVKVTRPAHDSWGIKKIVFTFCDDFLQKVLDLPYSQDPKWRSFLLPIYNAVGIEETQVVRSLLASMPPGLSIPVHHDTGYWVKHTHRLHVAIETGKNVDFYVGPTDDTLKKYLFDEGRIVELNNQAKHAVDNKQDTWRIHLIFDYVDSHPLKRHILKPGDIVYQTRRSIDLKTEVGTRKTPSFLILGSQKCGTTTIYEHLCQHPLVLKGKTRETHYFDWRWNHKISDDDHNSHYKYYMNYYDEKSLFNHPSLVSGESTPSYLFHSDIVLPRIKNLCPWAKLIAIFRNPTERAYSQYQMCVDKTGTPEQIKVRGMSAYINKSFIEIITTEINELKQLGIHSDDNSGYIDHKNFITKYVSKQPLTHGGHSIVARGLYAVQLEPWLKEFSSDQLLIMTINEIKGDKVKIQKTMDKLFSFIGLPPHDIDDAGAKNTREYTPIDPEAKKILDEFYEPYNLQFCQILGIKREDLHW
jgi:hypothetical protein